MSSHKPNPPHAQDAAIAFAETLQDPTHHATLQVRPPTSLLRKALQVLEEEGLEAALSLQDHHHRHRYVRQKQLGEGGMGVVDLVWDRTLYREVAQKRLQKHRETSPQAIQDFVVEARVIALLDHPNIIPIHDLGINEEGEIYLTMKRVQGQSLAELLQQQAHAQTPFSKDLVLRRLRIFVQLCHATAYAHQRGILHRDLKPANVLLGTFGEIYLTDWGLAAPLPHMPQNVKDDLFGNRETPIMAGTPQYMPPETLQDPPEPPSETNDIYALGVILFELLSPEVPFLGQQITHLQNEKRSFLPYSLPRRWPLHNISLASIVEKAAHPLAERRYLSVTALREDIERYLDGLTPIAEDATLLKRFSHFYFHENQKLWRWSLLHVDILIFLALFFGASLGAWFPHYFPNWLRWLSFSLGCLSALVATWLSLATVMASPKKPPPDQPH